MPKVDIETLLYDRCRRQAGARGCTIRQYINERLAHATLSPEELSLQIRRLQSELDSIQMPVQE